MRATTARPLAPKRPGIDAPAARSTMSDGRVRRRAGARPWLHGLVVACMLSTLATSVGAREAVPEATDPALEARMVHVTSELRCLVCQNQTIADSHADLAVDLRNQVREQLRAGRSDAQIVDYMTARYGDFVLYRPPFKPTTALLWVGPGLMLVIGVAALALVLRRRNRLAADAFDPDEEDEGDLRAAGLGRDVGHA